MAAIHIAGVAPIYLFALTEIKNEAQLELQHQEQLQKVHVTYAERNNPDVFVALNDKEFVYRGSLYDYRKVEETAAGFVFFGIMDQKEKVLVDCLKASFDSSPAKNSSKSPYGKLIESFSKDYLAAGHDITIAENGTKHQQAPRLMCYQSSNYTQAVFSPPDVWTTWTYKTWKH